MAEAITNRTGKGRLQAYSAGSQPRDEPNPWTLKMLNIMGYDTNLFRSKSWDEFTGEGAPHIDFVITLCDSASLEACPVWPGHPMSAHWSLFDPAVEVGDDKDMMIAFLSTYAQLSDRIGRFLSKPIETMPEDEVSALMKEIGGYIRARAHLF